MSKTVVGLFQSMDDAQAAMRDLDAVGLSQNASFAPQSEPELHNRLMSAGIPQQDADLFADGIRQGNPLIVVQAIADQDAPQAAEILDRHNVIDISQRMQEFQRMSLERTATSASSNVALNTNLYEGQDMVLPIIEEELRVGKRTVERGGLRIRVTVQEVPVTEQVTLREEHVYVDRRPIDQPVDVATAANAFREDSFEMRERREEAVVAKEARVVEEIVVNKQVEQHTEQIQDTVRRTNVDVEEIAGQTLTTGTTTVSGMTTGASTTNTTGEGVIEGGLSRAANSVERGTGLDLDRDGDVGQRDPRNNV